MRRRVAGERPGGRLRYTGRVSATLQRLRRFGPAAMVAAFVSASCITALAPDIRREAHHGGATRRSNAGACLKCHEVESAMAARMRRMDRTEMASHMRPDGVIRPPLVADWMVKDRRGCVACHAVKEPW